MQEKIIGMSKKVTNFFSNEKDPKIKLQEEKIIK